MKLKDFLSLFIGNTDVTIEAEQGEYKPMLRMTSTVETLSWMANENTLNAEIKRITKYDDELVIRVKFSRRNRSTRTATKGKNPSDSLESPAICCGDKPETHPIAFRRCKPAPRRLFEGMG